MLNINKDNLTTRIVQIVLVLRVPIYWLHSNIDNHVCMYHTGWCPYRVCPAGFPLSSSVVCVFVFLCRYTYRVLRLATSQYCSISTEEYRWLVVRPDRQIVTHVSAHQPYKMLQQVSWFPLSQGSWFLVPLSLLTPDGIIFLFSGISFNVWCLVKHLLNAYTFD